MKQGEDKGLANSQAFTAASIWYNHKYVGSGVWGSSPSYYMGGGLGYSSPPYCMGGGLGCSSPPYCMGGKSGVFFPSVFT